MSNVRVVGPAELAAGRLAAGNAALAAMNSQREAFARGEAREANCLQLLDDPDELPENA